jgi:tripartite-type tricarboxylate transporter receptor subunit TctC
MRRAALFAVLAGAGIAAAQNYPAKPVRMLTAEVGGGSDFAARLVAQGLSAALGQQVVVENRAGGVVIAEAAARAPADGYNLLCYGSTIWLLPFLREQVSFDPQRDFAPVIWLASAPNLLVVHPSLPVKSVRDLIALAKAHPGELNYSTGPAGTTLHLSAELFKAMAKTDIVHVPYKGVSLALNDLIAGRVQLMFPTPGSVTQHVKNGRLRALAVTSAQPSALLPGLPTIAATGLPGYESISVFAIFAPAKTPAAIIQRLNQETQAVLKTAETRARFLNAGVEPVGGPPEQLAALMKSEMAKWGKVIRDAGLRAE